MYQKFTIRCTIIPPSVELEYSSMTWKISDNAKEFLKGFNGYLHTDGFSGYSKLEDIHLRAGLM